jgi:hypothetical protein
MEAVAKYAYKANSANELSFNAGESMKIIPYDEYWCRGRINGKDGYVPKSYISEKPHPWFKGKITREESEQLLLKRSKDNKPAHIDGAFLIRNSENSPEDYSASVKFSDSVQHFKIFFRDHKYFIWQKTFDSFNELVDCYRATSISRTQQILFKDMSEDGKLYLAAFDFKAEDDSELNMRKDDLVRITDALDVDWWTAQNESTGRVGLVPSQYLKPYAA